MASETRGSGFVHLNTPSSITYTQGQTVSLTDLSRPRSRVECVVLPASVLLPWRQGIRQYGRLEGFQPFAADAEAARAGDGPVLPDLSTATRKAADLFARPVTVGSRAAEAAGLAAATQGSLGSSESLARGEVAQSPARGIHIVSHHKVSGRSDFVYPDYDGVLSGGVVPQVVHTAEEQAEKDAARHYYTSPLTMTQEELEAFEELQSLWRSRARSHSVQGAQHRLLAGDALVPGGEDATAGGGHAPHGARAGHKRPREGTSGDVAGAEAHADHVGDDAWVVGDETDEMLAEVLRMADDVLQLH